MNNPPQQQQEGHQSLCSEICMDTGGCYQAHSGKFWGGFCCIGILLACILIPLSIFDVSHDEYAIKYNDLTKKVDSSVVEEGKHLYTPQTKLFYYNKIVKTISFEDFVCVTYDGIYITMNLDVQYQLIKSELFDIFWEFGKEDSVKSFMEDIVEDSIRDVCGKYNYTDFPEQRDTIQGDMETTLSLDFTTSETHSELQYLELRNYEFPESLNVAIDNKQSALQNIDIASSERDGKLTIAQTAYNTIETEAETLINQAEGTATTTATKAEEEVTSIAEVWEARRATYESLMTTMGMTVDEFVEEYLYGVVLQNAGNAYTNIN